MKWMTHALIAVLVLGMAGVAQAKKHNKDNSGIKGRIVSVSPKAITVKEKGGETVTVAIDKNTTIEVNGTSATVSALQAGEHVRIEGGTDGAAATNIQVTGHKGGHKKVK